jgi:hypothetical protein
MSHLHVRPIIVASVLTFLSAVPTSAQLDSHDRWKVVDATGKTIGVVGNVVSFQNVTLNFVAPGAPGAVLQLSLEANGKLRSSGPVFWSNSNCTGNAYMLPQQVGELFPRTGLAGGAGSMTVYVPDPAFSPTSTSFSASTDDSDVADCFPGSGSLGLVPALQVATVTFTAPFAVAPLDGQQTTFTAIPACRVADTRVIGGPFTAGQVRFYDVVGSGSLAGQGGDPNGCGLPGYVGSQQQVVSAMLNIVAVNPTGNGYLRAGAGDQSLPAGSVLNYSAGRNVANAIPIAMAQDPTPGSEIQVGAFTSGTDVVIDVVGYYTGPPPP